MTETTDAYPMLAAAVPALYPKMIVEFVSCPSSTTV